MILYDDLKTTIKPTSKSNPRSGAAQLLDLSSHKNLSKKTRKTNNAMDTIDLNCCDPLLSSSHLALLCSPLTTDQNTITTSNSLLVSSNRTSDILVHEDLQISIDGVVEHSLAPPSPPWEDDDDVTMMMSSQGFKSFCNSSEMSEDLECDESNKVSSMVDEFLSYSPDSLRLDSDTDEAINSFLLEAAAAVANPSSSLSGSEMSSIKIENIGEIEEDCSNTSSFSLTEGHNSTQLSSDHNDLSTNTTRRCDDKNYSQVKFQKNRFDMLPNFRNHTNREIQWKKVVVTIDDDNNIIEEDDIEDFEDDCEPINNSMNSTKPKCINTTRNLKEKIRLKHDAVTAHCISRVKPIQQKVLATHEVCSHCSVCKLVFTSETQLAEHRLAYADRIACCHCCKTFSTMSKLRVHHRKHSKEKPFQCLSCGKYYTHRQSLLRHQLLYCPPLRDKCNSSGTSKSVIESRSEEENVLIKIENDSEDEKSELKVTSRSKESDITPFTKISTKCEDTLRGRIIDSNYKANYKATNNFKQNTTVYTKTESTSCTKSGGKRKRVSSKEIDIVVDEEETGCRVCDKEFYDVDSLVNHREYHLTHRTCCLCQKVMGNKSKLLTHHRSHTKELPYTCHVCEKRFAENSTLRKHEATHGERNFRCNVCSKAFVRKDYLAKHMLTHQQTYKCSQCGFVCHNRSDIEIHISEIHRG